MTQLPAKLPLLQDDPWLEPYTQDIEERLARYKAKYTDIEKQSGSLEQFADAYLYYGINFDKKAKGWFYREWAPAADQLFFIGDFNEWNRESHPMKKNDSGVWEIFLPFSEYKDKLTHGSHVKVHVKAVNGNHDRIPAYIKRVIQDEVTHGFDGQHWEPEHAFDWKDNHFIPSSKELFIYECHIGLAQEKEGIGTYLEFAEHVLPRIKKLGYNTLQFMAIQEHPYYGSYGYHVSNFFAPSSRFGTPEDLKYLVNKAHEMGFTVIMDIVHSHAVKNFAEGLNDFDGSNGQYFHEGPRGYHDLWDSKLFNYGKKEVLQFLLSNVKYWIEEFHFDGYRFDGITSMMYFHHGNYMDFDHYDKYFKLDVEWDAITYLQLANRLIHRLKPQAISIAEDMSGMPGLCRKNEEGGLGFDYRLGMGIPDYWIKILKEKRDEDWNIHEIWGVLTNRRWKEGTIAYAESHDQALVGDKTIAFWLMDQEMYWHMSVNDQNVVVERGIALHKMIRLFTLALGGEGYLNFIGNEFGHPEWLDFPREGNNWSYKYARRQWHLVDDEGLKYKFLSDFDEAMIVAMKENHIPSSLPAQQLNMDEMNKTIIFERGNLVFIFNFSPSNSIFDYRFFVPQAGKYKLILSSDDKQFGGFGRVDSSIIYETQTYIDQVSQFLRIYVTNRTALVLKKIG